MKSKNKRSIHTHNQKKISTNQKPKLKERDMRCSFNDPELRTHDWSDQKFAEATTLIYIYSL